MQVSGPVQGASTIPRRRRLNALLAIVTIVLIAAMVALMVWAGALARSGVGAQDANPTAAGAGSAVIHDDAGNVHRNAGSGVMWAAPNVHRNAGSGVMWAAPFANSGVGAEDAKPNAGAGSAIIHDDAGYVNGD